jgi:hypothetical protein
MKSSNFNLAKELADRTDADWRFGALSEPGIVSIPVAERENYLPLGETQFDQYADFTDCASRSPVNHLEALFTYHYEHGMLPENKKWMEEQGYANGGKITFSDRFVAVGSGTTKQGNSLRAPIDFIYRSGLIPKKLLPKTDDLTWDTYYAPIPQNLKDLGKEFLKRFTLNYEQVAHIHLADVLKDDMIGVAGYAWNQPDAQNIYHSDSASFNHAFLIYNLPKYQIFDNYQEAPGDYTKNLAPDYKLYEYGYRIYLSAEKSTLPALSIYDQLAILIAKIAEYFKTPALPIPTSVRSNQLYDVAFSFLGKDASPKNLTDSELACAESLSNIIQAAFPELQFPTLLSTRTLYNYLIKSPSFKPVNEPSKGDIIISVTGTGNGTIAHGHAGICGRIVSSDGSIWLMSTTSKTGLWSVNYTLKEWNFYFKELGGFPTLFLRPV